MTRREFVGAAALAAAGTGLKTMAAAAGAPNLRVGIMSDVHCHHPEAMRRFHRGLEVLRDEQVDAVLLAGDLFTTGTIKELEDVAGAWFDVFPDDRRPDGAKVERLFVTGNHDEVDWDWKRFGNEETLRAKTFYYNREATWKRLWGEDYEKIRMKAVKGYMFVLRQWLCRPFQHFDRHVDAEPEVTPAFMAKHGAALRNSGKPFFYVQHEPIDNTVNATWLFGGTKWDNGQTGRGEKERLLFSQYPNAVVLTGHSHDTLTDEMSIWQGGFTAVNCSSGCGYIFTAPGRQNGFNCEDFNRTPAYEMPCFDHTRPRQALVMDVFDDRIVFKKLDTANPDVLGPDWVVPLFAGGATVPPSGTPKYDFAARKAASKPPVFAADAKVSVAYVKEGRCRKVGAPTCSLDPGDVHPQFRVTFPPITTASSPTRAFDFRVVCEHRTGTIDTVAKEYRVYSPNFCMPESMETEPVACDFAVSAIPANCQGLVRFVVTPYDCWGNAGAPIASDWMSPDKLR